MPQLDDANTSLRQDERRDFPCVGAAVFPVGVLGAEEDGGRGENGGGGMQSDEVGDDEEVEAGVEGERVEVQETVHVGEGGGEVEVHFCGDADEAAGAGKGRHGGWRVVGGGCGGGDGGGEWSGWVGEESDGYETCRDEAAC